MTDAIVHMEETGGGAAVAWVATALSALANRFGLPPEEPRVLVGRPLQRLPRLGARTCNAAHVHLGTGTFDTLEVRAGDGRVHTSTTRGPCMIAWAGLAGLEITPLRRGVRGVTWVAHRPPQLSAEDVVVRPGGGDRVSVSLRPVDGAPGTVWTLSQIADRFEVVGVDTVRPGSTVHVGIPRNTRRVALAVTDSVLVGRVVAHAWVERGRVEQAEASSPHHAAARARVQESIDRWLQAAGQPPLHQPGFSMFTTGALDRLSAATAGMELPVGWQTQPRLWGGAWRAALLGMGGAPLHGPTRGTDLLLQLAETSSLWEWLDTSWPEAAVALREGGAPDAQIAILRSADRPGDILRVHEAAVVDAWEARLAELIDGCLPVAEAYRAAAVDALSELARATGLDDIPPDWNERARQQTELDALLAGAAASGPVARERAAEIEALVLAAPVLSHHAGRWKAVHALLAKAGVEPRLRQSPPALMVAAAVLRATRADPDAHLSKRAALRRRLCELVRLHRDRIGEPSPFVSALERPPTGADGIAGRGTAWTDLADLQQAVAELEAWSSR